MSIGLPAKYQTVYSLGEMDEKHFLVSALETAKRLDWQVFFVDEKSLRATTNVRLNTRGEEFNVTLKDHTAVIESKSYYNQYFDFGQNKLNIDTFLSTLEAVKNEMSEVEVNDRWSELADQFSAPTTSETIDNFQPNENEEKKNFFSLLIPSGEFFITPILIYINVLVFVGMVVSGANILTPNEEDLIKWGANFGPLTAYGQWWRLFSACFVHIGLVHLLLNMYALAYVGLLLEPLLGRIRFLAAYLITGIAASVVSLNWNDIIISAGASGAIFGMYGVFIALLTTRLVNKNVRKYLLFSIAIFVGYNLLYGLIAHSGIDNVAHIGGLISGILVGYVLFLNIKYNHYKLLTFASSALLSLVLLIFSISVLKSERKEVRAVEKNMNKFAKALQRIGVLESMVLEVLSLPKDTPKEVILTNLEDRGVYYWNECLLVIDSIYQYKPLPPHIKLRTDILKEYCEFRIKSYNLLYKTIEEDTDRYKLVLETYEKKIDSLKNIYQSL